MTRGNLEASSRCARLSTLEAVEVAEFENGRLELLSDQNSALVLIDFQRTMFKSVASGDKSRIKLAAICAAKAAKILGVPVVLSAINPKSNGDFIPEITGLFPGQEVFARKVPGFDAFEDEGTWNAVKATGKRKLVVSGLWTSMCFTYSALHAIREGYDAYGLMDAAGDSTPEAHQFAVERMLQAGVIPITVESLVSEWMHDWANPKAGELVAEVYSKYGAMIGEWT
jgi:nicotinamidase-related amidase